MATSKLISTGEAAELKGCTRKAIRDAVLRGDLGGEQAGRFFFVRANKKFEAWQPNPLRQQIGRESQKPKKSARKRK
jgi:hypothetical protein